MIVELPNVYPNGIAFDAQQRLYWTESMAHRICRMEDGVPTTFCQLPDSHVPDGMAIASDGRLFVYGPFRRDGAHTAPSNAAFDASLRAQDPEWGVRDTGDIAAVAERCGLRIVEMAPMPANNFTLVIGRA